MCRAASQLEEAMRIIEATAFSDLARKTVESASDLATVFHNLIMDVRDSCRPGQHYMRGPGPKWRAKHQPWLGVDSQPIPSAGQHELLPVHARRRDAASHTR
jgi:hypothetical protein